MSHEGKSGWPKRPRLGVALWTLAGISACPLVQAAPPPPPSRGTVPTPPRPAPTPLRPVPTRPGLSWEAADSFVRKSLELDQRFRSGRFRGSPPIELTDFELNSYVNLTIGAQIPPTVTGLEARFVAGRIVVQGNVDLDRVRDGLGDLSPWNPLRLLAGMTPVVADAALETEAGVGRVSPKETSLGALPIPSSVLATIVAQVTRTSKQPRGIDILSPFPLPYGIQRIRLSQGRARIEF